ncbi:hypothetical protein VKT23_010508 [Stygiomarasmius scandens]|uniref:PLAC8-domain-containing protein n=1 Tax=Marasmiellus scandens TaxID=2682957 RepID=A0ABR1JFY6_9AGAR
MAYPPDNKNPVMSPPDASYQGPYAAQQPYVPASQYTGQPPMGTPSSYPGTPPQMPNAPSYGSGSPPMAPGYVNQQPGTKEMMMVAPGGNRNARNKRFTADGKRDWSTGICSCCGEDAFGKWCMACWCPCIVYGENMTRLEHLTTQGTPHPEGGDSCGGDTWLHCCLTTWFGAGWCLQIPGRSKVRSRYSIDGGFCTDCCTICWCTPCALTQEHLEIQLEERSFQDGMGRV